MDAAVACPGRQRLSLMAVVRKLDMAHGLDRWWILVKAFSGHDSSEARFATGSERMVEGRWLTSE